MNATHVVLWVCFSCINADANGEDTHEQGSPEPWAYWDGEEWPSITVRLHPAALATHGGPRLARGPATGR